MQNLKEVYTLRVSVASLHVQHDHYGIYLWQRHAVEVQLPSTGLTTLFSLQGLYRGTSLIPKL